MTKRALIITGGWDGHEPKACGAIFAEDLRKTGFEVILSETLDSLLDKQLLASLNLIVPVWTMGAITGEQSKNLCAAVREGGVGLGGWHGGMCDAFRNDTEYQFMTGGQWVAHPGGIVPYTIHITNHRHPITRGLNDFQMLSEQYYLHTDPGNKVLATTTFAGDQGNIDWIKGVVMPQLWTRLYGKGRVFYCAVGHVAKEFEVTELREVIHRGLIWAAR